LPPGKRRGLFIIRLLPQIRCFLSKLPVSQAALTHDSAK
jgi:hypothetical protein